MFSKELKTTGRFGNSHKHKRIYFRKQIRMRLRVLILLLPFAMDVSEW